MCAPPGTVGGAGFDLTLDFSGTTSIDGAAFTGLRYLSTGIGGTNLDGQRHLGLKRQRQQRDRKRQEMPNVQMNPES